MSITWIQSLMTLSDLETLHRWPLYHGDREDEERGPRPQKEATGSTICSHCPDRDEPGPVVTTSPRTRRHHRVRCRRHHTGLWTINYYFLFTWHVDVFCLTSYKKYACMPLLYTWRRPHWSKRCVYIKSFGSLPRYTYLRHVRTTTPYYVLLNK